MSQKEPDEKEADKKHGGAGAVTVVLRADLHCEGCAHKVKRSIKKHFHGVEKVKANYESGKVTVVGKVDPAKVKERVDKKTKKPAQILTPKPANKVKIDNGGKSSDDEKKKKKKPDQMKPPVDVNKHNNNSDEIINPKQVGKVADLAVTTVVLKTRVHCDSCAHKINKIIKKYEGVEEVRVDIEKDTITVKGKMDMKAMLPYLTTKLKRVVEIAPPPPKNDVSDKPPKDDGGRDKKGKEESKLASGNSGGEHKIKKEHDDEKPKTVNSGGADQESVKKAPEENTAGKVVNEVVNKMEYNGINGYEYGAHTYDPQHEQQGQGYVVEYWNAPDYTDAPSPFYLHAPQMFNDENPNACSVM